MFQFPGLEFILVGSDTFQAAKDIVAWVGKMLVLFSPTAREREGEEEKVKSVLK